MEIDSPISTAMDLKALRESRDPTQRALADLAASMSQIKTTVENISHQMAAEATAKKIAQEMSDIRRRERTLEAFRQWRKKSSESPPKSELDISGKEILP